MKAVDVLLHREVTGRLLAAIVALEPRVATKENQRELRLMKFRLIAMMHSLRLTAAITLALPCMAWWHAWQSWRQDAPWDYGYMFFLHALWIFSVGFMRVLASLRLRGMTKRLNEIGKSTPEP